MQSGSPSDWHRAWYILASQEMVVDDLAMIIMITRLSRIFMKKLMDKGEFRAASRSEKFGGNNNPRRVQWPCRASNR